MMMATAKLVPATAAQIAAHVGIDLDVATFYLDVLNEATTANNAAVAARSDTATVSRATLHVLTTAFGLVMGLQNIAAREPMLGPVHSGHIE